MEEKQIQTQSSKEIVSKSKMLEAGVYFGTRKSQWNPKMKPYILSTKKGTHIIDIQKTKRTLEFAYGIIKKYAEKGASFIFVGTRKQAQATVKENALRTNSFYVAERWLGGTLTNNHTIFKRVRRMFELEKMAEGNFEGYTKKEGVLFTKELTKLQKNLNGIRNMKYKPNVMICADPMTDLIAIKEAQRSGIKVIGIVDTNVDPSIVDIAIPANDDSIKSVTLIMTILADAIVSAKNGKQLFAYQPDEAIKLPEDLVPEWKIKKEKRRAAWEKRKAEYLARKASYEKRNTEKADNAKTENVKYEDMKVAELKELAEKKGLDIKGKTLKAELVEVLKGAK